MHAGGEGVGGGVTTSQASVVAVLRSAKREIETLGWTQRESGGIEGIGIPCCSLVAISRVSGSIGRDMPVRAFRKAIASADIIEWNDAFGRTVEQVYAAFDKAIALVESGAIGI